jgi:hypothetical protein
MCAMHPSTGGRAKAPPRSWLCSPAELYGALRWLDVPSVTADDVADLIEAADKNRDGMLDYREYMSMLQVGRRCSAPCPGHTRARARTHRFCLLASDNQSERTTLLLTPARVHARAHACPNMHRCVQCNGP